VTATIATGRHPYVGRFAPSPTGPLHFGSLLAAAASYIQARASNGRWLVRIEDIDPPREDPGATTAILAALECYGFEWDGPVIYQSASAAAHEAALQRLLDDNQAYPCSCSRRDLSSAQQGPLGTIYPGTCRNGSAGTETATRVRTTDAPIAFTDALQGRYEQRLESETGDFVIWRRDGLVAYHLAVVVDDFEQGVTEIVRGIDLLDSTPRQVWLQDLLGYTRPGYLHIPVATHQDGQKLSKLTGAAAVPMNDPRNTMVQALEALGQRPPNDLRDAAIADIWAWACHNWEIDTLVGMARINVDCNAIAGGKNGLL
jgi:glutamyl-Q tRNA(Asp) synthetase